MDFFGNVQNVEVEGGFTGNETAWQEELQAIERMINKAKRSHNGSMASLSQHSVESTERHVAKAVLKKEGAVKVNPDAGWGNQIVGTAALLGCLGVWAAGSWLEARA
jgi:hypothetical protein